MDICVYARLQCAQSSERSGFFFFAFARHRSRQHAIDDLLDQFSICDQFHTFSFWLRDSMALAGERADGRINERSVGVAAAHATSNMTLCGALKCSKKSHRRK